MKKGDCEDFVSSHVEILIFGFADVGKAVKKALEHTGKTVSFVDNSSLKQGEHDDGTKVLSLDEARKLYPHAGYIVASVWHAQQIADQLRASGVPEEDILTDLPAEIVRGEEARAVHAHMTPRKRLYFEVNITKHCNLNCKGCDHFAPVADPEFLATDEYVQDVNRLSELFHQDAERIVILGGEPLLHPDIISFLAPTRRAFPQAAIEIATNGTLIKRMSDDFWTACRENSICIIATRYPVAVDYDELERYVKEKGVDYHYVGSSESGRTLWKFPLDLTGSQDAEQSFAECRNANTCLTLEHGRLYTCSVAPNIAVFNRAFKQNIHLTDADGIDIYKAQSAQEVLAAMSKPMPFCRYCDVKHREYDHPWEVSEKSMREWT